MAKYTKKAWEHKHLFIGIDLHRKRWHVTVRCEGLILFSNHIDGNLDGLLHLLDKFRGARKISTIYEAGYFGFSLNDAFSEAGFEAHVISPNKAPVASGNRVKTDKMDSDKLAEYFQSDILKGIYVPTEEERTHRSVVRRRRQLMGNRVRTQNRIKAELRFYGLEFQSESKGKWSQRFVEHLCAVSWRDEYQQESFRCLLEEYDFLLRQIEKLTALLKKLSNTEKYQQRVKILTSASPGAYHETGKGDGQSLAHSGFLDTD